MAAPKPEYEELFWQGEGWDRKLLFDDSPYMVTHRLPFSANEQLKGIPGCRHSKNIHGQWEWRLPIEVSRHFGYDDRKSIVLPTVVHHLPLLPFQREARLHEVSSRREGGFVVEHATGLGKTATAIDSVAGQPGCRTLAIVPAVVVPNWHREFVKWGISEENVTITSWHTLHKVTDQKFDKIIADEIHNAKNPRARMSEAFGRLRLNNPNTPILGLTATFIIKEAIDLWHPLHVLFPGRFGTYWQFARRYCTPPESPVWMGDYSFKPIGEIKVGDEVIGWEPRKSGRDVLRKSKVVKIGHRQAPIVKLTMESGRTIRCTPDHRWRINNHNTNPDMRYNVAEVGRQLLDVIDPTPASLNLEQERDAGWLAGMYDGEGSWTRISQSSVANPDVWEKLGRVASNLGLEFSLTPDSPATCGGLSILGGRRGFMDFVKKCAPTKRSGWDETLLSGGFKNKPDRVISIEPDGFGEVVSLQTETGNYVVWGYASKNCNLEHSEHGVSVSGLNPQHASELRWRLDSIAHQCKDAPKARVIPLMRYVKKPRIKDIKEVFRKSTTTKIDSCVELFQERAEEGKKKFVVMAHYRETARQVAAALSTAGFKVWHTSGEHSVEVRDGIIEEWKRADSGVLVCTIFSVKEGIRLSGAEVVCYLELVWSPGRAVQSLGRFSDLSMAGQSVLVYFTVVENSLEERQAAVLARRIEEQNQVRGDDQQSLDTHSALVIQHNENEVLDELSALEIPDLDFDEAEL